MNNQDEQLSKRFSELSERACNKGYPIYSCFLTLAEQEVLRFTKLSSEVTLDGGYEYAERKIAEFYDESGNIYARKTDNSPLRLIKVTPKSMKFADELTHRDFLGSLLSLGITREKLGDIIIDNNCGYVFCLDTIEAFLIESLVKIKHTDVLCEHTDSLPECALKEPERRDVNVASERLDALIAAVYKLSRSDSSELFERERISLNGRVVTNGSATPDEGDIISVRGFGRFRFGKTERESKKGRLFVSVYIY